ncbi:MAG: hypothetical protein NVS3B20_01960 [Polyangiales bacterium]
MVDGTWELFRAHFSKRPDHRSPDGKDVKATVGVVASLLSLLHDEAEAVTHIAVAFDNPIRSFRNDLFADYKSDEGVDRALLAQFDSVEAGVRALGVVVWSMDRFEADDALATAAHRYAGDFEQVRILTPDKDLGQCVRGSEVVQFDRLRNREIDESKVRELRGVAPSSVPDLLALVGDSADGIPGLPGIGAKTAAILLSKYLHLEAIPTDPRTLRSLSGLRNPDAIAATLLARRDDALLYRKLATLITDVPLAHTTDQLAFQGVPRGDFHTFCEALAVPSWKDRPTRWRADSDISLPRT